MKLPMPSDVIDQVHTIAQRQKASNLGLVFTDRNAMPDCELDADDNNDDEDDDSDYIDDAIVRGGSRKLGFFESNQELQSTVVKQDQDRTAEYRKKNEAWLESVINVLASVNGRKRRIVTWDPNIIINDKRKRNDGWITVTRRNGNRCKEL
jgi:hypothetical protein